MAVRAHHHPHRAHAVRTIPCVPYSIQDKDAYTALTGKDVLVSGAREAACPVASAKMKGIEHRSEAGQFWRHMLSCCMPKLSVGFSVKAQGMVTSPAMQAEIMDLCRLSRTLTLITSVCRLKIGRGSLLGKALELRSGQPCSLCTEMRPR